MSRVSFKMSTRRVKRLRGGRDAAVEVEGDYEEQPIPVTVRAMLSRQRCPNA